MINYTFSTYDKEAGKWEQENLAERLAKKQIEAGSEEEAELFAKLFKRHSQLNVTAESMEEILPVAEAWGINASEIRKCESKKVNPKTKEVTVSVFYAFRKDKQEKRVFSPERHVAFAKACIEG